jgi:ribosome-associated protein
LESYLIAQARTKVQNIAAHSAFEGAEAAQDEGAPGPVLPLILNQLDEDQAQEVVTIDLAGKSDMADAIVIASGRSQRHVASTADHVIRALKDAGHGKVSVEGLNAADWVLIDAGDVVVHLFRPEVRSFYKLERLWAPETFAPASEAEVAEDGEGAPATDAGVDEAGA